MLIWAMFDFRYKLDQIGTSWCKLEGAKEKKRGARPQSSRLDSSAETPELKIEESSRLNGDPGDYINNPNQAKSPRGILMKIQLTGWYSRRLDSHEVSFEESPIVF